MHELSIALSILDAVGEEAQRRGGCRVAAVHLRLGPLAGVVKQALLSAYEVAREATPLPDCRLVIEDVPVTVLCPTCAAERPAVSMQEMRCAACGTPTPQVVCGRELQVTALEIL